MRASNIRNSSAGYWQAQAGYPDGFYTPPDCPDNRYVNDEALCIAISAMLAKVNVRVRVNAM